MKLFLWAPALPLTSGNSTAGNFPALVHCGVIDTDKEISFPYKVF